MSNATPTAAPAQRANTFPWPPVLLAIVLPVAWALGQWVPLSWPGLDDTPARLVGLGFGVAGAVLVFAAVWALRRHNTTIMPHGTSNVLVTSGPYAFFRNPIYLGEVLMMLTLAEVSKNVWFVAAAFAFGLLVTMLQVLPEERHLEARFGDQYLDYKRRTRRWI